MDYGETELDKFTTFDGTELDIHIWTAEEAKGILLCIHGGMAHAGDYVNFGNYFKDKGYTSVSYDLRGHKQKRIKLKSFDDYITDTSHFVKWVKEKYPGLPIYIVGHSMGCNIVTKYLITNPSDAQFFEGTIFSSPYFGNAIKIPGIMKALSGFLAKIMPNMKVPAEDFTPYLSHDTKQYDRFREDERKNIRGTEPSIGFGNQILKIQKWIPDNIEKLDYPLLVFVAGDDRLSDVQITKTMLNKLDHKKVTQHFYENNYHENFNETNRDEIFEKMLDWMSKSK
ncbi:MAG: alpha/beta hydrolase [Candidatus Heimdallarchaeota archaeon]|nr:alpha/beta hydrolase [Candidatus Heimdallarchaeota archaeon]